MPADVDQIVGDDAETDPPLHAVVTFIEAAVETVSSLEETDAPFRTGAPFLSLAKPALLLVSLPLGALGGTIRYRHLLHPHGLSARFVLGRVETGIGGD